MRSHQQRRSRIPRLDIVTLDDLTGLLDQRSFEGVVGCAVQVAAKSHVEVSLILIRTHDALAPRDLARMFTRNVRSIDVVGRFTDGTFALLVEASSAGALRTANRLTRLVGDRHAGRPAWAGIATVSGPGTPADLLIAAASVALGRASADPWGWIEVANGAGVGGLMSR